MGTSNIHSTINSESILTLLNKTPGSHPDQSITFVMDNSRYQRRIKVQNKAQELGI